jgi:Na+/phosphate symporter
MNRKEFIEIVEKSYKKIGDKLVKDLVREKDKMVKEKKTEIRKTVETFKKDLCKKLNEINVVCKKEDFYMNLCETIKDPDIELIKEKIDWILEEVKIEKLDFIDECTIIGINKKETTDKLKELLKKSR